MSQLPYGERDGGTRPVWQPVPERFVNSLRARAETIRLAPEHATLVWTVRVQSADTYDAIRVVVIPATRVAEVKRAAMAALMPDVDDLDEYVVKLRGFLVDEAASLDGAGALDGSTFLIVSRLKRPVR
ncbi:MAG: hypothetical protein ABIW79_00335 [Gemmatimonas sp.]